MLLCDEERRSLSPRHAVTPSQNQPLPNPKASNIGHNIGCHLDSHFGTFIGSVGMVSFKFWHKTVTASL